MAAELKKISPTSYTVRRHYSSQLPVQSYTQSMATKRNSGINLFPKRDPYTPPIAYEINRKFPDLMRAPSQSRDRSCLSVDRQMYSRGYSQPPVDRTIRNARARITISQTKYNWS